MHGFLFPGGFCFQLAKEKCENLKPRSATSSLDENTHGGRKVWCLAFTERMKSEQQYDGAGALVSSAVRNAGNLHENFTWASI